MTITYNEKLGAYEATRRRGRATQKIAVMPTRNEVLQVALKRLRFLKI